MKTRLLTSAVFVPVMFLLLVDFIYADDVKDFVSLNNRISPTQASDIFSIPRNRVFIVTDIVIQNRSPGDEPVTPGDFSRILLGPGFDDPSNIGQGDFFLTVVGNETLNIHFATGIVIKERFRVFNVGNSTAPFIEFLVNGFLTRKDFHR